ncbi:hypothetical protein DFH08DRAFT_806356 [Mycena albidolilacea]|uniref:Uncharacterized protein n=1 Tax=Mycena albidolilacea TaxID=1033008 RepID=A0AAD7EVP0_9AGAR|nr:hypothetical protein DFH08DRAFT_806356 [Mycena albidolilacea]
MGAGGRNVEWVQVAGTWNGCGWQACGMDVGGWVAVCRADDWVLLKSGAVGHPTNFLVPPAAGGAPHLKEVWGAPHPVFVKLRETREKDENAIWRSLIQLDLAQKPHTWYMQIGTEMCSLEKVINTWKHVLKDTENLTNTTIKPVVRYRGGKLQEKVYEGD